MVSTKKWDVVMVTWWEVEDEERVESRSAAKRRTSGSYPDEGLNEGHSIHATSRMRSVNIKKGTFIEFLTDLNILK